MNPNILRGKHFTSAKIHSEHSQEVYGTHTVSLPVFVKERHQFVHDGTDLTDGERQGRPKTVST